MQFNVPIVSSAVGGLIGFSLFVYETTQIGGIYYKIDKDHNKKFVPTAINDFIRAPFNKYTGVWATHPNASVLDRIDKLKMNWIVMTTFGMVCGYSVGTFL